MAKEGIKVIKVWVIVLHVKVGFLLSVFQHAKVSKIGST